MGGRFGAQFPFSGASVRRSKVTDGEERSERTLDAPALAGLLVVHFSRATPGQFSKALKERIAATGRQAWQKETGYRQQAHVEGTFLRYKRILGGSLRAKGFEAQTREAMYGGVRRVEQDVGAREGASLRGRGVNVGAFDTGSVPCPNHATTPHSVTAVSRPGVRDLDVRPHRLETYDALTRRSDDDPDD